MHTRHKRIEHRCGPRSHSRTADLGDTPRSRTSTSLLASLLAFSMTATLVGREASAQCGNDPVPSGVTESPANAFSVGEYAFVHSSTNLQGRAAFRKIAAGLFWNPVDDFGTGVPRAFGAFSSAVIVNNPDPVNSTTVEIRYYDAAGTLRGMSGPHTIPANGMHREDARILGPNGGGFGSAHIEVVDPQQNGPIVGSTLHYFDSIAVPGWGVVEDPDKIVLPSGNVMIAPGEGSYQQLQEIPVQDAGSGGVDWRGWHFAGPFRFTNTSVNDFDNGSAPVLMVANPHSVDVNADVVTFLVGPNGLISLLGSTPYTINANGMLVETGLWNNLNQISAGFTGHYDFDILVAILARDGAGNPLPLVGDALVIDAFGDDDDGTENRNLNLGKRMRMVSMSISGAPGAAESGTTGLSYRTYLYASDVSTYAPSDNSGPMIRTSIKVANTRFDWTGPLTVEYFDHDGTLIGIDSVQHPQLPNLGLAPGGTLHIGLGEAQTPNFPRNMWNGSVRVSGTCDQERLIGWTAREICEAPASWPRNYQFFKAYGEEMTGANGNEPGIGGIPIQLADGTPAARRVASLVKWRTSGTPNFWPGYTTFTAGFFASNTGEYLYRFHQPGGTEATNLAPQPFDGVSFGASSLTYEDSDPAPYGPLALLSGMGSGKVDVISPFSFTHGINVLGGVPATYEIGAFARRYLGPGDIIVPGGADEDAGDGIRESESDRLD